MALISEWFRECPVEYGQFMVRAADGELPLIEGTPGRSVIAQFHGDSVLLLSAGNDFSARVIVELHDSEPEDTGAWVHSVRGTLGVPAGAFGVQSRLGGRAGDLIRIKPGTYNVIVRCKGRPEAARLDPGSLLGKVGPERWLVQLWPL